MSKKKFDFQQACGAMLTDIGAKPVEHNYLALNTVAGLLLCTPYENWLHCRFDDVRLAKQKIDFGTLNPFSGKWNWHFTKPTPNDVEMLRQILRGILQ